MASLWACISVIKSQSKIRIPNTNIWGQSPYCSQWQYQTLIFGDKVLIAHGGSKKPHQEPRLWLLAIGLVDGRWVPITVLKWILIKMNCNLPAKLSPGSCNHSNRLEFQYTYQTVSVSTIFYLGGKTDSWFFLLFIFLYFAPMF